jgi:hypothetical protein
MKAFFVINKHDDSGEVVFAETRGNAIYKSEVYIESDYTDIRATRLPKMDDKPLTDENIYLAGLIVSCNGHCYGPAADWENGGDPFFDEKGRAWCSDCWKDKQVERNLVPVGGL